VRRAWRIAVERGGLPGLDGVFGAVDDEGHPAGGDADGLGDSGLVGVAGVVIAGLRAPAPHLDGAGGRVVSLLALS
jgi:hypothetical protein